MKLLARICTLVVLGAMQGCGAPDIPNAQPFNADLQAESSLRRARVNSTAAITVEVVGVGRGQSVSKTYPANQE